MSTPQKIFQDFLKARSVYRSSAATSPRFSYGDMVAKVDPNTMYLSRGGVEPSGKYQHAADMVSADNRARDMRNMSRQEYFTAFLNASQNQDAYEAYRLRRYELGGV